MERWEENKDADTFTWESKFNKPVELKHILAAVNIWQCTGNMEKYSQQWNRQIHEGELARALLCNNHVSILKCVMAIREILPGGDFLVFKSGGISKDQIFINYCPLKYNNICLYRDKRMISVNISSSLDPEGSYEDQVKIANEMFSTYVKFLNILDIIDIITVRKVYGNEPSTTMEYSINGSDK